MEISKQLKKDIVSALKYLVRFTNKKIPILGSVLMNIKSDSISLFTTNTDTGAKISIPVPNDSELEERTLCVPVDKLYNIFSLIDDDKINVKFSEKVVKISTNSYTAQIKTQKPDMFPDIFNDTVPTSISVNRTLLFNALNDVMFASSAQSYQPMLEGINFILDSSGLTLCATNSFRLAYFNDSSLSGDKINIAIPKQFLAEAVKMPTQCENVDIGITNDHITIQTDNIKLSSRLLSGKFPNYQTIIEQKGNLLITIGADELSNTIKKVLVSADTDSSVILELIDNDVLVKSSNKEGEFAKKTIHNKNEGSNVTGRIRLNGKLLLQYLNTVSDMLIDVHCDTENNQPISGKPVVCLPHDDNTVSKTQLKYIQAQMATQ